jgi:ribonuclease BN (tRNA processing enzyme)
MRITVVGSGDAFGSGGRFQTCIALGTHTLIDYGATSLVALRQQGFDPNAIDTVLLSHLHGDHFGGTGVPGAGRAAPPTRRRSHRARPASG